MKRTKEKKKLKATIRTPVEQLSEDDTIQHYNAVMIENINSKIDLVIDGLESLRHEVKSDIGGFRNEMNNRFEILEAAIKCNAQGIRELREIMQQNSERLDDHQSRINQLENAS